MGSATHWTKLNWEDPFELDVQLTEERMVKSLPVNTPKIDWLHVSLRV